MNRWWIVLGVGLLLGVYGYRHLDRVADEGRLGGRVLG